MVRIFAIVSLLLFLFLAVTTMFSAECLAADRLNLTMRPPTKKAIIVIYPVFWRLPEKPSGKPIRI